MTEEMKNEIEHFIKIVEKWRKQGDFIIVSGNKNDGKFAYDDIIRADIAEIDFSFVGKDGASYSDQDRFEVFYRNSKLLLAFPESEKVYNLSAKKFEGIRKMRLYVRTMRESLLVYMDEDEGFLPIVEWNLDCPYYETSQKTDEWVSNLYLALMHGKDMTRKREREVVHDGTDAER